MRLVLVTALVLGCRSDTPEELLEDNEVEDLDLFGDPGDGEVFDLDVDADPELVFTGFGLMGSPQHGTWTAYDARAVKRGEDLSTLDLHVIVDMESVETGNNQLTRHLKTADFFDVDNHPTAEFRARDLVHVDGDTWRVNGTLTLRATTADWSWETRIIESQDTLRAVASMTFSRWDWGLYPESADEPGDDGVSDEVLLDYDVTLRAAP